MNKDRIRFFKIFGEAFNESVRDQISNYAGALAFFQLLSLAPLIGFGIFLSFRFFGVDTTTNQVIPFLKHYFTAQFVEVIKFLLSNDKHLRSENLITLSFLSGIAMGFSTREFFGMVKDVVELTWNHRRDKSGIINLLIRVKEDLMVTLGVLVIFILFTIIGTLLPNSLLVIPCEIVEFYVHIVDVLFELLFYFTLSLFFFVKLAPVKVRWKNALVPAVLGAVLQTAGREIMKVIMCDYPTVDITSSLLIVLFWFYYSNIVFFFSAEFSKVYISKKQHINYKNLKFENND